MATVPATVAPGDYPNVGNGVGAVGAADQQPVGTRHRRGPGQRLDHQGVPPGRSRRGDHTRHHRDVPHPGGQRRAVGGETTSSSTDTLPAGLTRRRGGWSPSRRQVRHRRASSAPRRAHLGDLPPGTTVELELDVFVDASLVIDPAVGVTNTATVPSDDGRSQRRRQHEHVHRVGRARRPTCRSASSRRRRADRSYPATRSPVAGSPTRRTSSRSSTSVRPTQPNVVLDRRAPARRDVRARLRPVDPDSASPYDFCTGDGADPETVTCTLAPTFDLPAERRHRSLGIEFTVDPTSRTARCSRTRRRSRPTTEDGNPGNNTSTAQVTVRAEVNLVVEKLVVEMDANGDFVADPPIPLPAGARPPRRARPACR